MNPGRQAPLVSDVDRLAAARRMVPVLYRALELRQDRRLGWRMVPHVDVLDCVSHNPRRDPSPPFRRMKP